MAKSKKSAVVVEPGAISADDLDEYLGKDLPCGKEECRGRALIVRVIKVGSKYRLTHGNHDVLDGANAFDAAVMLSWYLKERE